MKKVLSLVLVAVLAIGMSTTAFAVKYTGFDSGKGLVDGVVLSTGVTQNGDVITFGNTVYPINETNIVFKLEGDQFIDDDLSPAAPGQSGAISSSEFSRSKIAVKYQAKSGSKAFKSVALDKKKSEVKMKFATEYVGTKDVDFEIFLYLTFDGKADRDNGVTIMGTLNNEEVDVDSDWDYVDLSEQIIAKADEYISKIEADLGNGVSVFTKMFADRSYYGTADLDVSEADDSVIAKYPSIEMVYNLKTVGLSASGNIVKISDVGGNYFVYDGDLNYLGKSSEMLPYSTKYYLSATELDGIDTDDTEEEPEEDDEEEPEDLDGDGENPGSGGDGPAANNVNANPGTGR